MEHWEFLLQKKGDRAWLPIESPNVEILEGRYRVVARSSRKDTPIEIRVSYTSDDLPPQPYVQTRTGHTNANGLISIIPFTHLQPGSWELRCTNDLMSDFVGERWQQSVHLQVLAQEDAFSEIWEPDLSPPLDHTADDEEIAAQSAAQSAQEASPAIAASEFYASALDTSDLQPASEPVESPTVPASSAAPESVEISADSSAITSSGLDRFDGFDETDAAGDAVEHAAPSEFDAGSENLAHANAADLTESKSTEIASDQITPDQITPDRLDNPDADEVIAADIFASDDPPSAPPTLDSSPAESSSPAAASSGVEAAGGLANHDVTHYAVANDQADQSDWDAALPQTHAIAPGTDWSDPEHLRSQAEQMSQDVVDEAFWGMDADMQPVRPDVEASSPQTAAASGLLNTLVSSTRRSGGAGTGADVTNAA